MSPLPNLYVCNSKSELQKQVTEVHQALVDFFDSLPNEILALKPIPDGWSIEGNMRHIAQTNRFIAMAIGMWKPLFKVFGKPSEVQPSLEDIPASNRKGITEYGTYPKGETKPCKNKEKLKLEIMQSAQKLNAAIEKRTEEELDTLGAPFKMSLRTFVYFSLKHNLHHANIVRLRLQR
jgi:hypothetical protein